jgi:hypothetical protein
VEILRQSGQSHLKLYIVINNFWSEYLTIPFRIDNWPLGKSQTILGKASLRNKGTPLSSCENPAQNRQALPQRARFKEAYSALHEFERGPLFLHSRALIKLL